MDDHTLNLHFGNRLRARRVELGLSQSELGKAIGVASQQVQKYEKGANSMTGVRLYEFSRILKVPVSYFFDGLESAQRSRAAGFGEETATFNDEAETASDREVLELLKSFRHIRDADVRKRFSDMLRTISLKNI